jgi:hypothetical protein
MIDTSMYAALKQRQTGSVRQLARELNEHPAVLADVLNLRHEHVSAETLRRIRGKLGIPNPRRSYLRPCLSLDPAVRAEQLRRLLAAAEAALETTP